MEFKVFNANENFGCLVEESWEDSSAFLDWYKTNEAYLNTLLQKYAVIKLRKTGLKSREDFDAFNKLAITKPLNYVNGNSPRTRLSDTTYTSTEFPAESFISLHNEMSYSNVFPEKIIFFCLTPPGTGGETPVLDGRPFLSKLDPVLAAGLENRGIKYIRNLHGGKGIGLSWQTTFETNDKAAVELFCQNNQINFTWLEGDALRLEQTGPVFLEHPVSKKLVWFNQAEQFHPSSNTEEVYESLKELFEDGDFPITAVFEDDSAIPETLLDNIRAVAKKEMVALPWEKGDIMIMDNIAALHGRNPFTGQRSILVSMGHY
jgi:alpha-ketoglutarate-dependent taurine dioxygenase